MSVDLRTVTIVIPTFNRRQALEAVWPSYVADPAVARIVVVDDGGNDGTAETVERLARAAAVPVTLLRHDRKRGAQASKTTGLAVVETEWVLFGEDDVYLGDGYCTTLIQDAETTEAAAIAGRLVTSRIPGAFNENLLLDEERAVVPDLIDMAMLDADYSARTPTPVSVPFLHAVALVRRNTFERVSFDDSFTGNGWREETDLYLSMVAAGDNVVFTPNAVCYHLRGAICASGGQRIPRWRVEYYAWRNTLKLVSKHWGLLSHKFGFRGSPNIWTLGFIARRERDQVLRWVNGHRSSFKNA